MGNTIVHLAAHAKQFVRDTILKEAEQQVGAKYVDQVLDTVMRHFYIRAEMRKHTTDKLI
jgi:hypothetical protein